MKWGILATGNIAGKFASTAASGLSGKSPMLPSTNPSDEMRNCCCEKLNDELIVPSETRDRLIMSLSTLCAAKPGDAGLPGD